MDEPVIKGLPEGVKWTGDFLPATKDDYEIISTPTGQVIYKGVRPGAPSGVKVEPEDGYVFVQIGHEMIFDPKTNVPEAGRPQFQPAKKLDPPKTTTITVKFSVNNQLDADALEAAIKGIPNMAGYVEMERRDG